MADVKSDRQSYQMSIPQSNCSIEHSVTATRSTRSTTYYYVDPCLGPPIAPWSLLQRNGFDMISENENSREKGGFSRWCLQSLSSDPLYLKGGTPPTDCVNGQDHYCSWAISKLPTANHVSAVMVSLTDFRFTRMSRLIREIHRGSSRGAPKNG